ncbi:serine/threonine protein kinase [Streptomyces sp. APSN-46.1]|uniref:serine/threonine-protein kinase n=1 Tax=Streptomyces sp. APSN-46.1 TaxID=2929049 RepID=UPI001FB394BE|nr:serine/threonine-protein kinase [Streptomyces sp. APSN-46.1]MCJ1676835.1 serine/threonine protein kinase [Streptomyces sp. APSN-46.1]
MSSTWTVPGYTEVRDLGSGGSGRVVLAVHDGTGTAVAVKYLSDRLRQDPAFVGQFRAEARLLGGLRSPYVVGLYEYVEAPGGAAIVMELVDGVSLRALLKQSGRADAEAALVVLKGSLLGLAAAHRAGVVHRDYKPENVLVSPDGSSKLVDFGIAAGQGTTPGVAGTPAYMAPEQWQGQPASPAADVYAATATFFECLTGRKPFDGENFAELAVQHIEAPVPETEAPEPVRPLIRRGLAKRPEQRPSSAEEFVAELEGVALAAYGPDWEERGQRKLAALAALLPLLFPSAGASASGTTAVATTVLKPPPAPASWAPGRRGLAAAGVALVVGTVLVLTYDASGGEPGGLSALSAFATTTPTSGDASPGPGPTASVSPSASPSTSPSASVSPSATPSSSASPTPTPTPTPKPTVSWTPTPTPKPTPTPTPTPSPTLKVTKVDVSLRPGVYRGEATVSVAAEGTGPITVVLQWFLGSEQGVYSVPDGTDTVVVQSGAPASLVQPHTFSRGRGCYGGVRVTTKPAAGNKSASDSQYLLRCQEPVR